MEEKIIYELLKENIYVQDKALKKLIWALYRNFYLDFGRKQNVLLIGERGTGKTTMLKEVCDTMDISLGEVYDLFMPNGINISLFLNAYYKVMNNSEDGRGIMLLHDFQNSFLYGQSMTFNSMLASEMLNLDDYGFWDISDITFVGEIDTNNVKDIFLSSKTDLSDLDSDKFLSPTLNIVKEYLTNDNRIKTDEDDNKTASIYFERYITEQIKNKFLSSTCFEVFPVRIHMEDMSADDIIKALSSPISVLNLYRNDLTEEYINSKEFIQKVSNLILESDDGLHFASKAIENTFMKDLKHKEKVLKKDSLFLP